MLLFLFLFIYLFCMVDHDYRQGVRYLEHLRKAQIETMNHAMKVI